MSEYKKLNEDWIEIEYVEDEHEEENDFKPSFWWNNQRYFLDNFIRTHNNPWVSDNFPDYIHAYEAEVYHNPLFIELNESGEAVNVFKYVDNKEE